MEQVLVELVCLLDLGSISWTCDCCLSCWPLALVTMSGLLPSMFSTHELQVRAEHLHAQAQFMQAWSNLQSWDEYCGRAGLAGMAAPSVAQGSQKAGVETAAGSTTATMEKGAAVAQPELPVEEPAPGKKQDAFVDEKDVNEKREKMFEDARKEDGRWQEYVAKHHEKVDRNGGAKDETGKDKEKKPVMAKKMPRPPSFPPPPYKLLDFSLCFSVLDRSVYWGFLSIQGRMTVSFEI